MRQKVFPLPFLYLSFLLLAACTLDTEYFKDYKDVNLIGNRPLSRSGTYTDGTFWWGTGTDPDSDSSTDNDPLMGFQEMTATIPGPLNPEVPSATPVYRLEIKNLIPNGDFTSALDTTLWTESGPRLLPLEIRSSEYTPVPQVSAQDYFRPVTDGNPALWLNVGVNDVVSLDLRPLVTALEAAYGESLTGSFSLRWNFRAYNSLIFNLGEIWSGSGPEIVQPVTVNMNTFGQSGPDAALPVVGTIPSGNNPFPFPIDTASPFTLNFDGRLENPQNIVMDDLRMVYGETTDLVRSPWLELRIPRLEDAALKLLPGKLYKFSIWVKNEAPADLTPLTPNAYPATHLSVKIEYMDSEFTLRTPETRVFPAGSAWDNWTRLDVDLKDANTLQFPADYNPADHGGRPVLKILLSPTDQTNMNTPDAGRLLLAYPSFIFREKF